MVSLNEALETLENYKDALPYAVYRALTKFFRGVSLENADKVAIHRAKQRFKFLSNSRDSRAKILEILSKSGDDPITLEKLKSEEEYYVALNWALPFYVKKKRPSLG